MSLKELTSERHALAEGTAFMKAVFAKELPMELWTDFTFQKFIWYTAIEKKAKEFGLLENLKGIERSFSLFLDYNEMAQGQPEPEYKQTAIDYAKYLSELNDPKRVLAHLYTWHMGDMFGGQMIKKIIIAPHRHLDFEDAPTLVKKVRELLTDDLADEANVAFDWAIKIMQEYDKDL